MKINYKTTTKICVVLLIWDAMVQLANRSTIEALKKRVNNEREVSHLLAQKMDAHGVELDTFDEIAIRDLIGK